MNSVQEQGDGSRVPSKRWNSKRSLRGRENSAPRGTISRGLLNWRIASALNIDSEWNECHEASYLLSNHHLRHLKSRMKLPKFLRLPGSHCRQRSKARSEMGATEGQGGVNPTIPRPTESTPDLLIGTSTLPAPSPCGQESNGMLSNLSWRIHLSNGLLNGPPHRCQKKYRCSRE